MKDNIYIKYYFYKNNHYENNNFGDGINPLIFNYFIKTNLLKKSCIRSRNDTNGISILGVGSIMHRMRKNDIVFGSGILSEKDIPEKQNISNKIKAVRGPLTRNLLLQLGANCNEVYGDPALLLPFIIKKPIISKKYKIGIIPHYLDYDNPLLEKFKNLADVLIINILSSYEPEKFINNISMCEVIYSSSLHGVIVGDAYGIPSYHILISDKVLGNNFKFNDYFASVNRKYINIKLTENTTVSTLIENIENYKPIINLKKLIYNFPFIDKKIKKSSMEMLDDGFMNYIHGESSLHY